MSLEAFLDAVRDPWRLQAACRGMNTELFYAQHPGEAPNPEALAACERCTVRAECLAYAVDRHDRHGIWGGLPPRRRQGLKARPEVETGKACGCGGRLCTLTMRSRHHGTSGGYRHKGCRCDSCRAAWRNLESRARRPR
jgi:WhiB family redox-sensing transcriptional regulator